MTTTQSTDDFDSLVKRLHRRARRLNANPADAADLAQEVALKLWHQHCTGVQIDNEQAYAMTALHNLARSRWRNRRVFEELQDDTAATPPDALRRIACAQLRAAVARLPPPQGELMALVAAGETSPAHLARITGVPVGTVMSRLARARMTLRADMGMDRDSPSAALYDS